MNFFGAVGNVMQGSGLKDVFAQIYRSYTVDHVMNGKIYARAIRGHIIVHNILTLLHLKCILHCQAPEIEAVIGADDSIFVNADNVTKISKLIEGIWNDKIWVDDCRILTSKCLQVLNDKLDKIKTKISIA